MGRKGMESSTKDGQHKPDGKYVDLGQVRIAAKKILEGNISHGDAVKIILDLILNEDAVKIIRFNG